MSPLFKSTIIIAVFFAVDKVLAFIRQVVIARQFGLSAELDAFNAANNLPDLLFSLISGGALSLALIPVLTEYFATGKDKQEGWKVFSTVANITFALTVFLAILVALFAEPLVSWELGIAPGFNRQQQELVFMLMRLNLIATLVFSISGFVMSGLQSNKHFLLPALAPSFYNVGQIIGALILAPSVGYALGPLTLPAFGFGIHGLVYGVILGSILHLGIQIPGLLRHNFQWTLTLDIAHAGVKKILHLMGPRFLTVFLIQLIFLARDNMASRLQEGAVTALTYGWFIMQVPETLIGTAIATALLPTISEHISKKDDTNFFHHVTTILRVMFALTLPATILVIISLRPLVNVLFNFPAESTDMFVWTTQAYMLGLVGHSLLEVITRTFYAQRNAKIPFRATLLRLVCFIAGALLMFRLWGPVGIALADTLAVTLEVIILFVLLKPVVRYLHQEGKELVRIIFASLFSGLTLLMMIYALPFSYLINSIIGLVLSGVVVLIFIRKEIRLLISL